MTTEEFKVQKALGLYPRYSFLKYCDMCKENTPHIKTGSKKESGMYRWCGYAHDVIICVDVCIAKKHFFSSYDIRTF